MNKYLLSALVSLALVSCGTTTSTTIPTMSQSVNPTASLVASSPSAEASPLSPTQPATDVPSPTGTAAAPADAVVVNTFDQEIYPFKQNGNCSLGEAIWAVQTQKNQDACVVTAGASTIYLPKGNYTLTEPDTSSPPLAGAEGRMGMDPGGFPLIYTKVTIQGNSSTIQRTGANKFGIFQLTAAGNLSINDLTISGGDTTNVDLSEGGGIDIFIGQARLTNVTITKNISYNGGGIAIGPGATLVLNDSTVNGNNATNDGGGIYSSGTVMLKNSIISGNTAQDQALGGGGIYNDIGQVTLDHSLLVSNLAFEGGGIYSDSGKVNVINQSVVSGNVANEVSDSPHGGGGINSIGTSGDALVTIKNSSIIGNLAPGSVAGGIYVQGPDSNSTVLTITDSILASNSALASGGILIDIAGTGSITNSCIIGNTATKVPGNKGGDIDNGNQDQVPFSAANNWWGSPGSSGNVSQFVTTQPSLTTAPTQCAGAIPTPYPTPGTH